MIDVLRLTASQAERLLDSGEITSVQLAKAYLTQISKHNHDGLHLNAAISLVPREKTLAIAQQLDDERRAGHKRGPLHGIPFVWKDVFTTKLVPCTAGAPSLLTAVPRRTAPLMQHLLDSGGIPLFSANLTEFCGMKMEKITPGWSPAGGQTQSPYVFGGNDPDDGVVGHSKIGGSSAGSACAVAAGFAPLSIGTECCGSLILPASRAAAYGLKCGLGKVDTTGALHYTDNTDYVGGIAKSADDLATFTAALMQRSESFDLSGGLAGLRLGFVNSREWQMSEEMCHATESHREYMDRSFEEAKRTYANAGAQIYEEVDLQHPSKGSRFEWKSKSIFYEVAIYQMQHHTFPEFFNEFEESEVRTVADMIKWNVDHADRCLPPEHPYQNQFYDLLHSVPEKEYLEIREKFHRAGDALLEIFDNVDVLVAYGESSIMMYTSAAGCPIATAPLGTIKYSHDNERPFGLSFAARPHSEGLLLRVLAAHQELYPDRPLPRPLLGST